MINREEKLKTFVTKSLSKSDFILSPLNGDASFRKYYRVENKIAVDSPPDTQKNHEFLDINKRLSKANLFVPCILEIDLDNGFFLLNDLGNVSFFDVAKDSNLIPFYKRAIDELLKISKVSTEGLPLFDREFIRFELSICDEWLYKKALSLDINKDDMQKINNLYDLLIDNCLHQKQIAMHRDYHCRNIMYYKDNLYIIDYQDMVQGPLLYDLASLLYDCYICLDDAVRDELCSYAYKQYKDNFLYDKDLESFKHELRLTALQRHIKVLGIFCRLYYRDNKSNYLKDLPLVLDYVMKACKDFSEFNFLYDFLDKYVKGHLPTCEQ